MPSNDYKKFSEDRITQLRQELDKEYSISDDKYKDLCIFACGSLGRHELTENSDLDLFFVSVSDKSADPMTWPVNQFCFFSKLHDVSIRLGYGEPSRHGEYWKITNVNDLLDVGSRTEDFNNSFTTRLLLLLESKPLYNDTVYNDILNRTINKYFVDYQKHKEDFYPQYLMNDILRYWYTLTLNYEYRRDSADEDHVRHWKRLKLKFARQITCFSLLACLFEKGITPEHVIDCVKKTPYERLDFVANNNLELKNTVKEIKTEYDWFLNLRSMKTTIDRDEYKEAIKHANQFHQLLVHDLICKLSDGNPELKQRMEIL